MFATSIQRSVLSLPRQSRNASSFADNFLFRKQQHSVWKRHKHTAAKAALSASTTAGEAQDESFASRRYWMVVASMMGATAAATVTTFCEEQEGKNKIPLEQYGLTPANVGGENFEQVQASHDINSMPIYTSDQVAENNGEDGKPIWMSYGGVVYDVTNFISNHPGGSEKIMTAAGSPLEPFWHVYRQHFASDLPIRLMEHMAIGRLKESDQDEIEQQMMVLEETTEDPYIKEPRRDPRLVVHSDTPMNAECPAYLLTESYLTPPELFYIRHHHPVPYLTPAELAQFSIEIDISNYDKGRHVLALTLDDLAKLEKVEVTTTLQCSGNFRRGFNDFQRTSGTNWGQGAVSTAKWGGVRLKDVFELAGLNDPIQAQEVGGMNHVCFTGIDEMKASIPIEKVFNPYGDVILAYEMNGQPVPRDHGGPVRVIVPGYSAVRNVKWVQHIKVSAEEADGPWQRGLNYKALPPSVTDANDVDISKMPPVTEASLYSGITKIESSRDGKEHVKAGDRVTAKVSGWAWAGGGRNIVRVDVTPDNGKTWHTAILKEGSNQRFGRAWAWTFWECDNIPCIVGEDGQIELASKAVDMALNAQPESCRHSWNVRGLGNNSWFRAKRHV